MSDTLVVNEIYLSLQGESTFAGLPCVFVRLTACNLRCSYCDTAYAFTEGQRMTVSDVREEVLRLAKPFAGSLGADAQPRLPLVELTGGEPLLQQNALPLMSDLCDSGFTVLLETSGAHDIGPVDSRVRRIMDLKCPSSGEEGRNRWANLPLPPPHRRNQICDRHPSGLRVDPANHTSAQTCQRLSAAGFVGPPAQSRTATQVAQTRSFRPDCYHAEGISRADYCRRFASALSGSVA